VPAKNLFDGYTSGAEVPALRMTTIAPSDASDLPVAVRMIYVGVGGDVNMTDTEGNTVLHKNAGAGCYLGPFRVARVRTSGTTATNLVGYV
jgi:hypothetical protein